MCGQTIHPSEPWYSTYNTLTSVTKPTTLKGSEPVIIDYVAVDGTSSKNYMQKVYLQLSCIYAIADRRKTVGGSMLNFIGI